MTASPLTTLGVVALGGAIGAVARYQIALATVALYPRFAPAGTLVANVLGCFLIGLLMVLAQSQILSETSRQLWVTGGLGALTTFSTFGWQTVELVREGRLTLALLNVGLNGGLGFGAVIAGIWIGRRAIGA
ncbi:MAG: fluoride efflux transporter CrcB [Planctomycetaceae bacterium]|nr:fluoride efflux transporter CrcB [Planctomycetaceae bacterium]